MAVFIICTIVIVVAVIASQYGDNSKKFPLPVCVAIWGAVAYIAVFVFVLAILYVRAYIGG